MLHCAESNNSYTLLIDVTNFRLRMINFVRFFRHPVCRMKVPQKVSKILQGVSFLSNLLRGLMRSSVAEIWCRGDIVCLFLRVFRQSADCMGILRCHFTSIVSTVAFSRVPFLLSYKHIRISPICLRGLWRVLCVLIGTWVILEECLVVSSE